MPKGTTIGDILQGGRRRGTVALSLAGTGTGEFTFEALSARGPGSWNELKAQHPAGADDIAQGIGVDLASFIPAALAASCVEPKMTVDEAEHLVADILNGGEFDLLWGTCLDVNAGVNRGESDAASAPTARTRRSSKPRTPGPTASS